MKTRLPFISVIVCCYNGADVLSDALYALKAQRYDGRMEIIVVDDGSADNTYNIAKSFKKVSVIRCDENKGLAEARNTGVAAAKGEIVAFTDDDCRPLPTWLSELATAYNDPQVQGAGGDVISSKPDNLVLRYLEASRPLKPLENSIGASKKLTYRFGLYLKGILGITPETEKRKRTVYSLVGANMSFRKSVLTETGLFDPHFRFGGEEEDVCKRINELHPGSLLFLPKSKIEHQYERTLRDTLRRSKAYAKGNARMYHKYADVRPIIFPFPFLILLSTVLGLITPVLYITPIILTSLIYLRWTLLAIKRQHPEPLVYGYLQMLQECWANVGFVRGFFLYRNLFKKPAEKEKAPIIVTARRRSIFGALLVLLAIFNITELTTNTFQATFAGLCLLLVPGYLLLALLKVRLRGMMSFVLAASSSVSLLLLLSLLLNAITGLLSEQPHFSELLFVGGFDALSLCMSVLLWFRTNQTHLQIRLPRFWRFSSILRFVCLGLLPFAGIVASDYLNRNNVDILSMVILAIIGLTLLLSIARFSKLNGVAIGFILYSVSLTIILMGSTRGAYLSGTDISKEFYLFKLTQRTGHWSPSLYSSAYNACLSINLLPTFVQAVTKVSDQAIFRFIMPSFYALMPLGVFVFLRDRKKVTGLVALLATLFFMAQPVYLTWAAIPLRQMICLPLFIALMIVIFAKKQQSRFARTMLVVLFGTGMVLSHYSTTYLALGLIVGAYLINRAMYAIDVFVYHRQKGMVAPILGLPLIVTLCAISWLWLTPITHTSTNITHLVGSGLTQISEGHLDIFKSDEHASQSSLVDQFTLNPKSSTAKQLLSGYIGEANAKYKKVGVNPIGSRESTASLKPALPGKSPYHLQHNLSYIILLIGQALSKLSHVFMGVGLILIAINLLKRRKLNHEFGVYSLSAALVLVLVAVIPYASIVYDLGRTLQQMLLFIALPTIAGGFACLHKISFGKLTVHISTPLLGIGLVVFLLFSVGWIPQLTGGTVPTSLLNNDGNQYGAVVQPGEVIASGWLSAVHQPRTRIYAGYYARNRLWTGGNNQYVYYNELLPWTIDKSAYVYEDNAELQSNRTVAYYNGSFVTYQYPTKLLTQTKNIIYSNGHATIYK